MGDGLSRRDIIKGATAAGVAAWTAPILIDSLMSPAHADVFQGCSGIKVTPGTSNSGNLELCNSFATGGPDLSCLIPGGASSFTATASFPGGFWTIKLCGILATGLTGIGVKSAGNLTGCTTTVDGVPQSGAECYENHFDAGGQIPYPTDLRTIFRYTDVNDPPHTCATNGRAGHVVVLYPLGARHVGGASGDTIPGDTVDGTNLIQYPILDDPTSSCRWLFVDILPNINAIGLQLCFTVISPPAGC